MSWVFNPFTGTLDWTAAPPANQTVTAVAEVSIPAFHAVAVDGARRAYLADWHTAGDAVRVAGVSAAAASIGEAVEIVTGGLLTTTAAWTAGPLFVGAGGALVPTPAVAGYQLQVAVALAVDTLLVRPQPPIFV